MSISNVDTQVTEKGCSLGIITDIDANGNPIVAFAANSSQLPIAARSVMPLSKDSIGREAVLVSERGEGDECVPLVLGLIERPLETPLARRQYKVDTSNLEDNGKTIKGIDRCNIDGTSIEMAAEKELALHCGDSQITLTKAGKVIIDGLEIESVSEATSKIKGIKVELN